MSELGKILEIDDKVTDRINDVNAAIDSIATHAARTAEGFRNAINSMTADTTSLRDRLEEVGNLMSKMGIDTTKPLAEGLAATTSAANAATNAITSTATSLSAFDPATANIAQLTRQIKDMKEVLTTGSGVTSADSERAIVDQMGAYTKALKEKMTTTEKANEQERKSNEKTASEEETVNARRISTLKSLQREYINLLSAKLGLEAKMKTASSSADVEYYNSIKNALDKVKTSIDYLSNAYPNVAAANKDAFSLEQLKLYSQYSQQESQNYIRWWTNALAEREAAEKKAEAERRAAMQAPVKDGAFKSELDNLQLYLNRYRACVNTIKQLQAEIEYKQTDMGKKLYSEASLNKSIENYEKIKQYMADIETKIGDMLSKNQSLANSTEYLTMKERVMLEMKEKMAQLSIPKNTSYDEESRSVEALKNRFKELIKMVTSYEGVAKARFDPIYSTTTVKQMGEVMKAARGEASNYDTQLAALAQVIRMVETSQSAANATFRNYISTLDGTSMASQKSSMELQRMSEYYRNLEAEIQKSQTDYSNLEKELLRVQDAMRNAKLKGYDTSGVAQEVDYYNQLAQKEREISRQMDDIKRKNSEVKDDEEARLRAMQKEIEAARKIAAEQSKTYAKTTTGALDSARDAKTYEQRAAAIKNLEAAMKSLDSTSKDYQKNLTTLANEHKRLQSEQHKVEQQMKQIDSAARSTANSAAQLKNALVGIFSVQAISNYTKKLIEVRGEFELQNVALRAILQNKDEADQLFSKVIQLAVKSPFTVRQLTAYTRQLAAYQVESEKLFDTTKRLADVSAGLGVDMQRIILAFGQVKAANYLRATEVRQFTEAGINMLGELAKYYSELEGRMISVADVQEMVTKRMVEFGDVEAVFNRITDAGGIFYDMQEKQASTLKGMYSNLQDAIDIMLNQIGLATESQLKGAISYVRKLALNWHEVTFRLAGVVGAMGAYKVASAFMALGSTKATEASLWFCKAIWGVEGATLADIKAMTLHQAKLAGWTAAQYRMATAVRVTQTAIYGLGAALKTILPLALVALAWELVRALTESSRAAKRLQKDLDKIFVESKDNLAREIQGFEDLTTRMAGTNEGTKEREQLIEQLNNQYGEYLPFVVDETTTYEQLKDAIDGVNESLTRKYKLAATENALQRVYQDTEDSIVDVKKALASLDITQVGVGTFKLQEREINLFLNNYEKKVRELGRKLTDAEVTTVMEESLGRQDLYLGGNVLKWGKIREFADVTLQRVSAEANLQQQINNTYEDRYSTIQRIQKAEEYQRQQDEAIARAQIEFKGDDYNLNKEIDKINTEFAIKFANLDWEDRLIDKPALDEKIAEINKGWQSGLTKSINDALLDVGAGRGFTNNEIFSVMIKSADQAKGMSKIAEDVKNKYKAQKDLLAEQLKYKRLGLAYEQGVIDSAELKIKLYELKAEIMGIDLEDAKASKTAQDIAKERLDLIKKMRSEYEKNLKVMSKENALEFTKGQFEDNEIYKALVKNNVITAKMTLDAKGTVETLERLAKTIGGKARKEIEMAIATMKNEDIIIDIKANLDETKESIDTLFDELDLANEMKKLGLSEEITSAIFGIDTKSLDEVEAAINKIKEDYAAQNKGLGEDELAAFKKYQDKIDKERQKNLKENLKTYSKYLKLEFSEAVKIKLEEAAALAKISELEANGLSKEAAAKMKSNLQKETQKKTDENKWKEFQNTDLYIEMFNDLESVSTGVLLKMQEKLLELKDSLKNLEPTQLKEIQSRYNEIQDTLFERDGWGKAWRDYKKFYDEVKTLKASGLTEEEIETQIFSTEEDVQRMQTIKDTIDLAVGKIREGNALKGESVTIDGVVYELNKDNLTTLESQSNLIESQIATQKSSLKNLRMQQNSYKNMRKTAKNLANTWQNIMDVMGSVKDSIMKVVDAYELLDDDDPASVYVDMADQMLTMVGNMVLFTIQTQAATVAASGLGVAMNAAMGPIGWIVLAIEAIATAIAAVVGAKKKEFEAEMKSRKEKVEELQKAYEKLEDAIKDTYDLTNLQKFNKEAEKNLKLTIAQAEASIALYKAKKNGSKKYDSEISELQDAIDDAKDSLKELAENLTEALGGFGSQSNLKSAAEDFVSAWYDAFKETGDGLTGLEEQMDEFIDNAIKKQLLLRLSKQYIDPILERWDAMFAESSDQGNIMTAAELEAWKRFKDDYLNKFNQEAQDIVNAYDGLGGNGELDGLSAGIQGITEDTAEVLAAITESIRFFVADTNTLLHNWDLIFIAPEDAGNPWFEQMRSQTNYLKDIRDAISSVTAIVGLNKAMRVQIV